MKKRMICMLLTIVMLVGLLPVTAFADSVQGTITENTVWNDGDVISSAVTISGGTQSSPVMITVNGTVTVKAAITITGHVCITGGGTLQRGTGGFAMLKVNNGGFLTTYNVTIDGNTMAGSYNLGIAVASGGSLVINEGTVLRNHTTGGSYGSVLQIYGTVVMNSGIIENNSNSNYGNIYLNNEATFTMNGGIIRNNELTSDSIYGGGAIYVRTATFIMNGGSISGHHIDGRGGAIYCTSYGKVYLNGGAITDNSTTDKGDSVFYSCVESSSAELYIGGAPYITDPVYLDATKHPFITSVVKQPVTFELSSFQEGRVVAKGTNEYALTESDMSKITLITSDGTRYYAELDPEGNQLLMTQKDPGYAEKFYINYLSNGGTGTTMDSNSYTSGAQAVIKDNAFSCTGYTFAGWNTKADGSGTPYAVGQSISITGDVTLYAQWTSEAHSHSYTYTAGGNVITEFCTCGHQENATLTAPTGTIIYDGAEKKGATATYSDGWLGGELTVSYANNINAGTATASVQKGDATATVNFIISKADQSAPTGLTKTDETISKKADGKISGLAGNIEYRKEGENTYTAVNSSTLENLSAGKYYVRYAGDGNHNPSADVEIAIAEGRKLLVTYKVDGVTFDTVEVSYGDNADTPQLPGKAGYTGTWNGDGKNIVADTTINAVYAPNQYTITFDTDGGSAVDPITQDYGTVVEAPAMPTKEGYTFAGWDAIPMTMPAENLTIKANWIINKYTVTYIADGEVVDTVEVEHGKDATAPEIPAKEGYNETAPKWDKDGKNITADTEINAVYTINKYIVTYKADGEVVDTVEVEHGKDATAPEIPAKAGHTAAWDKDGKNITADTEINAVYTINKYTVTYKADGEVVDTVEVEHGQDATAPEIPAKAGHTAAWDSDGKNITADTEINAVYTINKYTVTYKADGEVVDTVEVEHGQDATAPEIPAKAGHTAAWDSDSKNITADTSIHAVYTVNQYTISFDTDGGSAIAGITQDYGTVVTAPAAPSKTGYTFSGWEAAIPATMPAENLTFKAKWTVNQYTITFDTDGGSEIAAITQDYGTAVTTPAAPTKAGYTFTGWDAEIPASMPAENVTIKAKWTVNQYTITFVDEDGTVLQTGEVAYGATPAYTGAAPTKAASAQYTYTFAGWDKTIAAVTGEATYKATYTSTINKYTVTYKADGKVVKTVEVEHGKDATAPEIPAKAGHTAAWDKDGKNITADTEINAVYTINKYTVTYKADGKVVKTVEVEHGKDATAPEIPAKEGYNETAPKWDKDGKNITADTEINAVYTKNQPGEYADVTPDTNVGGGKVAEEIEELKEKVPFTQEEEKQIEYGADVEVWLEIKDISDSVSSEEKAKVEEKLGDADVALYLDIAMFKQVGENEASRLTQLGDKVQITFKLDDSYINTDKDVTRTYSIIHVHDGNAEVITPVFDAATKTLTFETDRFSTYAVVYTDVENVPPTEETIPPTEETTPPTEETVPPTEETVPPTEKPAPPADTPATGDSFQPAFWIACMTLSIFGIAVLLLDAKRRHAR